MNLRMLSLAWAVTGALLIGAPTDAAAQLDSFSTQEGVTQPPAGPAGSRFCIYLRTGPYKPRVSDNAAQRGYYNLVYGRGRLAAGQKDDSLFPFRPLMSSIEVDWYPYDGAFGTVGVGGSIGMWGVSGLARYCGDQGCAAGSGATGSSPGNTETSFTLLPLGFSGIYRLTALDRYLSVPLIPYGRIGMTYAFWWDRAGGRVSKSTRQNADGTTQKFRGEGGTFGWHAAFGLMFGLDFIEPDAAQRARQNIGLGRSVLFFEGRKYALDGFGSTRLFDASDLVWSLGLGVDLL